MRSIQQFTLAVLVVTFVLSSCSHLKRTQLSKRKLDPDNIPYTSSDIGWAGRYTPQTVAHGKIFQTDTIPGAYELGMSDPPFNTPKGINKNKIITSGHKPNFISKPSLIKKIKKLEPFKRHEGNKSDEGGGKRGFLMVIAALVLIALGYLFYTMLGVFFGTILFLIFGIGGAIYLIMGLIVLMFG